MSGWTRESFMQPSLSDSGTMGCMDVFLKNKVAVAFIGLRREGKEEEGILFSMSLFKFSS